MNDNGLVNKMQVAIPDGWQLLPEEPTPEMIQAACDAEHLPLPMWARMSKIYEVMLLTAPKLEGLKHDRS